MVKLQLKYVLCRARHKCLLEEEGKQGGDHLVQLDGKNLAVFLEGIMHCSARQKVR